MTYTEGTCSNVLAGIHVRLLVADVGALVMPVRKIIGAQIELTSQTVVARRCALGVPCDTRVVTRATSEVVTVPVLRRPLKPQHPTPTPILILTLSPTPTLTPTLTQPLTLTLTLTQPLNPHPNPHPHPTQGNGRTFDFVPPMPNIIPALPDELFYPFTGMGSGTNPNPNPEP